MGQTQRGNLGFAAEAGSCLGSLYIAAVAVAVVAVVVAAAAEHTGSGIRLDIADKAAGSLLGALAVAQNDQTAGKACQSTVGQFAW
jgi:hypothetical protein